MSNSRFFIVAGSVLVISQIIVWYLATSSGIIFGTSAYGAIAVPAFIFYLILFIAVAAARYGEF